MNEHTINAAPTMGPGPAPQPGYAFNPGDTVGQYRVVRLLGRGGMGEVYEVEHEVLRRRYALKFLSRELMNKAGALERFKCEAEVMANLDHPNIVKVDEFGEHQGRHWLRMGLARGVVVNPSAGKSMITLGDLAESYGGKIPQEVLLTILQQVASGLAYAHGRGVVHRDIKPGNILLDGGIGPDLNAKVSDFGLVKVAGEAWLRSRAELSARQSLSIGNQRTDLPERTSEQALLGTYEYMSPEQRRRQDADARSDVYALGLLAFKLLTGRDPGTKPPSKIDPALWPAWDDLLIAALEFEPGARPADGTAFLARLQAVGPAAHQPTPATAVAPPPPPSPQPPPPPQPSRPSPAREESGHQPGDTLSVDLGSGVGMDLVWIPPGKFMMGSPETEAERSDDETQHRVTISSGFWMGKYEVTQEQYERISGKNPSHFKGPDLPVEEVSWDDAQKFCRKLQGSLPREPAGKTVRLPTEAEWEYACRAGTTTPFHYGDSLDSSMANFDCNFPYGGGLKGEDRDRTTIVGSFQPNAWGLYDMHGNVWEWCADWMGEYPSGSVTDPTGPGSGEFRVLRGGVWYGYAGLCRSANRFRFRVTGYRRNYVGFRVVVR